MVAVGAGVSAAMPPNALPVAQEATRTQVMSDIQAEVSLLIESEALARNLTAAIERDIHPENSW